MISYIICFRLLKISGNVGPTTVKAFEDLLTRIQIVHQSANNSSASLNDMLINCLSKIMTDW